MDYGIVISSDEFYIGKIYKQGEKEWRIIDVYTHHVILTDDFVSISMRKADLINGDLCTFPQMPERMVKDDSN